MLSYRKLAMRVLGRPLHTGGGGIDSPRPASQRAAAFILTAIMLTSLTAPAFAKTWCIEDGNITVKAGDTGNDVTQKGETTYGDKDTIITNQNKDIASSNTVTIETKDKDDKVEVKLDNVNIDTSSTGSAAVSVTGKGDTTIELDGDNTLKSGRNHAGLEHNQTVDSEGNVTSGKLTIQDKDNNGSLTATGGEFAAGIGGGNANAGQVTITGGNITATGGYGSAGIGGGYGQDSPNPNAGDGDVTISGGTIKAAGGTFGAGIGGGYYGNGTVTITGDAVIENASNESGSGAGIGGGMGSDGNVTISGNAQVKNVTGGYGAAGIGGGAFSTLERTGNGNVTIKDNAKIGTVTGGTFGAGIGGGVYGFGNVTIKDNATIGTVTGDAYGAGIGGGIYGLSNVTIEGNTKVNATGGAGGAAIGGGAGAENNSDNNGNQITIKSNENGSPTINAVGGGTDEGEKIVIGGAGIGAGCESDADADITLEGKVTITATAGKDNVAIGANGIEQEFSGLAEGSSITRYDPEGNDITLPTDPVPAVPSSSGGSSADASVQESVFPGLVVTDKDGQRISYTSTQSGNTLTVCVGRFTASLRASLAILRQLRAEGIDTITFQTILCSTTLSVDELLAMGGEDTEVVLTHHIRSSTLTVGGKAV